MEGQAPRRTLVVANRTASTPMLMQEIERRARERPTSFALLIPDAGSKASGDWTMEIALPRMERAARGPVEGIVGEGDPLESVRRALQEGSFDDVLVSTLDPRTSRWLHRDLPHQIAKLGVPVDVISPEADKDERNPTTGAVSRGLPLT